MHRVLFILQLSTINNKYRRLKARALEKINKQLPSNSHLESSLKLSPHAMPQTQSWRVRIATELSYFATP